MSKIDSLSLATVKLEQYCGGNLLSSATGFFYRKDSRLFLVSNWHVFSGRHPKTRQPLHSSCFVPEVQKMFWQEIGVDSQLCAFGLDADLNDADGSATWWEHPVLGSSVDIGVVELVGKWSSRIESAELVLGSVLTPKTGMDVFVLGYPRGLSRQGLLPIWKRGSIASEPNLEVDNQSVILIDTGTREGMSGSPVVLVSRASGFGWQDGELKVGDRARLIGVYSGRIGAEELSEVQLGLCWKASLIEQIIAGEKPANINI